MLHIVASVASDVQALFSFLTSRRILKVSELRWHMDFNRNPTPQIAGVAPVATASAASKPHHRASTRPPFPSARCAFWVRQQEPRFATIPEYAATGGLWRDGPSGPGLFQQLQRLVLRQAFIVIVWPDRLQALKGFQPASQFPLSIHGAGHLPDSFKMATVGHVSPAWSAPLVSAGRSLSGLGGLGLISFCS